MIVLDFFFYLINYFLFCLWPSLLLVSCRPSCGSRCSSPVLTMMPSRQPQSTTLPNRRSSRLSTRPGWGPGSKSPTSKTSSPSAPEGVMGPRDSEPPLLPPLTQAWKKESRVLTASPHRLLPPSHVFARTCNYNLWKYVCIVSQTIHISSFPFLRGSRPHRVFFSWLTFVSFLIWF